ncbi:hypothetical protein CB1_001300004 [Camelus ferus]|nr:hypothetical protein CB1_001300004 [Camelus ferus]
MTMAPAWVSLHGLSGKLRILSGDFLSNYIDFYVPGMWKEVNGQQLKQIPEFVPLQEGENFTAYCNTSSPLDSLQWYKQQPGGCPVFLMLLTKGGDVKRQGRLTARFGETRKDSFLHIPAAQTADVGTYFCAGTVIEAAIEQPKSKDFTEGEDVTLPCNHSTIGLNDYIHWYWQNPNQSPQYIIHGLQDTVTNNMASLTTATDRKSSTLVLPWVALRDSAVYYCALTEAQRDGRGCTCAVSPWWQGGEGRGGCSH